MFRKIKRFALGRNRVDSWLDDKHQKVIDAMTTEKGPHMHVRPPQSHLPTQRLITSHRPRAGSFSSRSSAVFEQPSMKKRVTWSDRQRRRASTLTKRPFNFPKYNYGSELDFWRGRPLVELDIKIRTLENENFPASTEEARKLKQLRMQLHDDQFEKDETRQPTTRTTARRRTRSNPTISQTYREGALQWKPYDWADKTKRSQSADADYQTSEGYPHSLPPHTVSGRFTRGNFPRPPGIRDVHRGFDQMSLGTQKKLMSRHTAANRSAVSQQSGFQRYSRNTPVDRHIAHVRRATDHTGLPRMQYKKSMRRGYTGGLDLDYFGEEMPRALSRQFRNARLLQDTERQQDSNLTREASLEVWRQRQLDKKYHPKKHPATSGPREHQFGEQEPKGYAEDWKKEHLKFKPFFPTEDHFSAQDKRVVSPNAGRSVTGAPRPHRTRSEPVLPSISSVPADDIPASRSQELAQRYSQRPYGPQTREQRIEERRQRTRSVGAGGRPLEGIDEYVDVRTLRQLPDIWPRGKGYIMPEDDPK